MADYSSRDTGSLNEFLQGIGPEYTIYTYSMLNAGVDKESIRGLSDEQLEVECRIGNSIHRLRILNAIRGEYNYFSIESPSINHFKILVLRKQSLFTLTFLLWHTYKTHETTHKFYF